MSWMMSNLGKCESLASGMVAGIYMKYSQQFSSQTLHLSSRELFAPPGDFRLRENARAQQKSAWDTAVNEADGARQEDGCSDGQAQPSSAAVH